MTAQVHPTAQSISTSLVKRWELVSRIKHNPGIHFEHIDQIKPITSEWKLHIYFKLATFYNELQLLVNGTFAFVEACNHSTFLHTQYTGLINHFQNFKDEMEAGFNNKIKESQIELKE